MDNNKPTIAKETRMAKSMRKFAEEHTFPDDFVDDIRNMFRSTNIYSDISLSSFYKGYFVCFYCGKPIKMKEQHMKTGYKVRVDKVYDRTTAHPRATKIRFHCDCFGPAVIKFGPREMIIDIYT